METQPPLFNYHDRIERSTFGVPAPCPMPDLKSGRQNCSCRSPHSHLVCLFLKSLDYIRDLTYPVYAIRRLQTGGAVQIQLLAQTACRNRASEDRATVSAEDKLRRSQIEALRESEGVSNTYVACGA
jgi:hypothetical protein